MLFNSLEFLLFFPVVTFLYFFVRHQRRWVILLVASAIFYMAFVPSYILILAFTILVDYFAGILIENSPASRRKVWLAISLITNVAFLGFFKYFNFINENARLLFQNLGFQYHLPNLDIILPIGLSFHTFQAMSYTIEVYRGHQKTERHLGVFALYVLFYPQLVAGPIERPQNMLHQFHEKHGFDYERVMHGLLQMCWGFFKKVVIADRAAIVVNQVFAEPSAFGGPALLTATYLFSFQIFCDFSAYSDIALGCAKVMGFNLMKNFDQPYISKNLSEFWQRWHISLSTWFRDYVYIPLGGNRGGKLLHYRNLIIVFMLSGVWHGANWTFMIWGAMHGVFLIAGLITADLRKIISGKMQIQKFEGLADFVRIIFIFHLVSFAWIFFRANSVSDAMAIIHGMKNGWHSPLEILQQLTTLKLGSFELFLVLIMIFLMEIFHGIMRRGRVIEKLTARPPWQRWLFYYMILAVILIFGRFESQQFIYFQF